MNSSSLQCVIDCDPVLSQNVCGVFAADEIPQNTNTFPFAFIVNTDPKRQPGRHWLAFYISSRTAGEFFDSFGNPPEYYFNHSKEFFNAKSFKLEFNIKRLQSNESKVCGQYCLFYLLNRCRNVIMDTTVNLFSNDFRISDEFVSDYITNTFPYCMKHSERCEQVCISWK